MSTPQSTDQRASVAASDYDVAVVGYGPVGQAIAALLGRAGHRVGVFERYDAIYPLPRAVHLDHEIMRILQTLGAVEELREKLLPLREYHWFGADGEPLFTMRNDAPAASGWEPDYMFFQPELELALDAAARREPTVEINRGWSAERLAARPGGVELTLRSVEDGREQSITSRFLIGADGANSTIREAAGIGRRDLGFREQWLVVDVLPADIGALAALPDACQWCDPCRPHMHARNGTRHRRWEFMLLPGETAADFSSDASVWELLEPFLTPADAEITRHAVYEFRSMLADDMRRGNVLLAGDAAHLTPPFMGQGLCTGLRDALNIAWKLDLVLRGRAPETLLDTVDAERRPQNEWIINLAVEMGRVSCELDRAAAAERDVAMRAAGELAPLDFAPLGDGVIRRGADGAPAALAGRLSVQGRVALAGRDGLFDDIAGHGLALIAATGDPDSLLSAEQRARLLELDARIVSLEELADIDGRLSGWLAEHGVHAVLVRPDFYVFGSAATPAEVPDLVEDLFASLRPPKQTATKETRAHA